MTFLWHLRGSVALDGGPSNEAALRRVKRLLKKQRKPVTDEGADFVAFDQPLWRDPAHNWALLVFYNQGRFWIAQGAVGRDVVALWLAARDGRTPLAAKLLAGAVAAYALSPIDLIPDFVPVLGYLDDLLIVPAGIALVIRLIPGALMAEFRAQALQRLDRPRSLAAAAIIVAVWIGAAALAGLCAVQAMRG